MTTGNCGSPFWLVARTWSPGYILGCPSQQQWQLNVYRDPKLYKNIIILVVTVTGQGHNPKYIRYTSELCEIRCKTKMMPQTCDQNWSSPNVESLHPFAMVYHSWDTLLYNIKMPQLVSLSYRTDITSKSHQYDGPWRRYQSWHKLWALFQQKLGTFLRSFHHKI